MPESFTLLILDADVPLGPATRQQNGALNPKRLASDKTLTYVFRAAGGWTTLSRGRRRQQRELHDCAHEHPQRGWCKGQRSYRRLLIKLPQPGCNHNGPGGGASQRMRMPPQP